MAVIATASNPRFWVSRVDIDRGGPTYTVDTISDIAAMRPGAELYFITGADALSQILSWKDAEEALELRPLRRSHPAGLRAVRRPPAAGDGDSGGRAGHGDLLERVRERVRAGQPVWYLVPDGVVQYIAKHRLY